ncbi:hypothetical protein WJX72_011940 [[Myrmecia] bisecta]|uniref:Uncharacterized protein n=1 Tax=[Myrmecia] bisecta TaxID=41462 RepID=A0AAW1RA48_9CHLO
MFYSAQILAKKGPLGTIWIAAHLDRRLKRHQVFETSIPVSVDTIINTEVPLALRLSGQLLLGVVRIYSRKVGYLFQDCNDALVKLKQAFKPGDVNLPADGTTAPMNAITLPDDYNGIDLFGANGGFTFEALDGAEAIGRVQFSLGPRDSFVLADDLSDMFGTQMSMDEERFEAAGEELERHLSIDDPEKLRSMAVETAQPDHFYSMDADFSQGNTMTPGGMDDDLMMAPSDDMLQLEPAGPTPARPRSRSRSDAAGPTPSLMPAPDAADALPDLGGMPTPGDSIRGGTPQLEFVELEVAAPSPAPRPAAQRGQPRRKRIRIDVDSHNRPNCELAGADIRALLQDRSSLMTRRGPSAAHLQHQHAGELSVALQADQAGDSALYHAGISDVLAPALYRLYQRALNHKQAAPSSKARRPSAAAAAAAAPEDAEEDHAAAAAAEQALAERVAGHDGAGGRAEVHAGMMDNEQFEGGAFGEEEQFMDMDGHDMAPAGPSSAGAFSHGDFTADDGAAPSDEPSPSKSLSRRRASTGAGENGAGPSDDQVLELGAEPDAEDTSKDSFTNRTKLVHNHLKTQFFGETARKRKQRAGEPLTPLVPEIGLNGLVQGKTRLDASRWFFEMLVLKTKNFVELQQAEPYADILIEPKARLASS